MTDAQVKVVQAFKVLGIGPYGGCDPLKIFPERNPRDNAGRRAFFSLVRQGLILRSAQGSQEPYVTTPKLFEEFDQLKPRKQTKK